MKPEKFRLVYQHITFNNFNYNFSGQSYNMEHTTLYPPAHKDLTVFLIFYVEDRNFTSLKDFPYTSLTGLNGVSLQVVPPPVEVL